MIRTTRLLLACMLSAALSLAAAHAVVRTETGAAESLAGKGETYRLQVPVERPSATTVVRLVIPAGVRVIRFLPLPGWTRTALTGASGAVTEVTWRGRLNPQEFQRFLFQATNPADAGTLVWKVYQTSADGVVTAWDDSTPDTPASRTAVQ